MLRALRACQCSCGRALKAIPLRARWAAGQQLPQPWPRWQPCRQQQQQHRQRHRRVHSGAAQLSSQQPDAAPWRLVPDVAALQEFICDADTGSALVTVLQEGAHLVPQLSSQYLALASQRLAHFEDEQVASRTEGLDQAACQLQEAATAELQSVQRFVPAHLAAMLGALASLGVEGPATDAFVVEAAQFSQTGAQRFDISHHVTLITAFAALTPRGKAATAEVQSYMQDVAFLLRFQEDNDHGFVQDGLQSSDFPGVSWALGRTLASQEAIDEWQGRGTGWAGPPLSSTPRHVHGVSPLMHTLAYRAKHHLANRHSGRAAFTPGELAHLVCGFALLGDRSPEVATLCDAVAGNVVRRVKARHLNAVSQLDLSAQLLWAFAELQHVSVATPELLNALGGEVARRLAPDGAAADVKALNPADAVLLPGNALRDIITVLHAHEQLGFCPREQLLAAVVPAIVHAADGLTEGSAELLFGLFERFKYNPGPMLSDLLLSFQPQRAQPQ